MIRFYVAYLIMPFWASSNNTIERLLLESGDARKLRSVLNALAPGFPPEVLPQEPPPLPARPIPTDVPTAEPMDVPVPEPRDVPPPDPGVVPKPARPRPDEKNPKPRSVP